jgi:YbbR domain-containing protein
MSRLAGARWARIRFPFDQLGSFLLALVLALVVWVVAEQQQNPIESRAIRRIPVTVHNLPSDLILIDGGATPTVDIEARATRSTWERLNTSDILAYVDLSAATAGRHELPVVIDPPEANVEVLTITPAAAVVRLESRVERNIFVTITVLDAPPFGYVAGPATATPPFVRVAGVKSVVDAVAEAEVRVRIADARANLETSEFVTLRDRSGAVVTGLEVDPRTIAVAIPINQRQGVSEKSVLPRVQGQPAANYRLVGISADPATVTLIGDPAALEALPSFVETTPITIENATGNIEERVPLVLPETVSAATSQSVVVRIAIEPIFGSQTMTLKAVVQGLSAGLQVVSISPETIDVILQGPLPRLQTLTEQNVQAVIDLSELGIGTHTIKPLLLLPDGVSSETILPETVQVIIAPPTTTSPTPAATSTPAGAQATPKPK